MNPIIEVAATAAYFGGCFFVLRYLKKLNRKYGIDGNTRQYDNSRYSKDRLE